MEISRILPAPPSSPFCASCDSLASRAAQRRPSCNSQIPIQRGSGLPQLIAAIPIGRAPGNGGAFAGGQPQLIAAIPIGRAPGNGGAFAGHQSQLIAAILSWRAPGNGG